MATKDVKLKSLTCAKCWLIALQVTKIQHENVITIGVVIL